MIRATRVHEYSPYLGDECSLCKQPLASGDQAVICPQDASRHHVHCWQANGNRCTAYGCTGQGEIVSTSVSDVTMSAAPTDRVATAPRTRSKVRVLPSNSLGCAQSCLLVSIALAILLFAVGCFGLWALADYIALELLGWQYRVPLSGSLQEIAPGVWAIAAVTFAYLRPG